MTYGIVLLHIVGWHIRCQNMSISVFTDLCFKHKFAVNDDGSVLFVPDSF